MMMPAGGALTAMAARWLDVAPILAQFQHLGAPPQGGGMHGGGGFLAIGLGLFVCFGVTVLLLFGFWIWMLVDCLTRDFPGDNDKVIWVLVIVFLHALGALIYLFAGRPRGTRRRNQ